MAHIGGTIARLSQTTRRNNSNTSSIGSPSPQRHLYHNQSSTASSFEPDYESTQNIATFSPALPQQDESVSIELGRGTPRPLVKRQSAGLSPENSLYDLTGLTINSEPTNVTPKYGKLSGLADKPSVRRSTTMPTTTGKITSTQQSDKPRTTGAHARRSLSAMHAKLHAHVESSSFIENFDASVYPRGKEVDERPNPSRPAVRNVIPTRFTVAGGLERKIEHTPRKPFPNDDQAANMTAHSFMLPDLPNIAELVSGVRKDGTPIFSKTSKSRSRFTSATYERQENLTITDHARVVSLPLPDDEKAIFASLQVLKDRVGELEAENRRANETLDRYASENARLNAQTESARVTRRADGKSPVELDASQLQVSLQAARSLAERTEQKNTQLRAMIERLTSERDGLVTQLGVAFYTNEELKSVNSALQQEQEGTAHLVEELQRDKSALQSDLEAARTRVAQTSADLDELGKRWVQRETDLTKRIARRDRSIAEMRQQDLELSENEREAQSVVDGPQGHMSTVERKIRKVQRQAARRGTRRDAKVKSRQALSSSRSRSKSQGRRADDRKDDAAAERELRDMFHHASEPASDSDVDSVIVDLDMTKTRNRQAKRLPSVARESGRTSEEVDGQDLTFISFLDPNELSRLRKQLEEERRAAKGARDATPTAKPSLGPRKSSLKDVASAADRIDNDNETLNPQAGLRNVRIQSPQASDAISYDHLDVSSKTLNDEPVFPDDATAAVQAPEVVVGAATGPELSQTAIDPVTSPPASSHLIPVSTRQDVDASTATVRPSIAPASALASVIKLLETQLATSKRELAQLEAEYNSHDPAVGRRRRVELKGRIDSLLAVVEERSEVVYRLYDVVEGV